MIILACIQAMIVAGLGWILWTRKRRLIGGILMGLGLAVALLALVGLSELAGFSR